MAYLGSNWELGNIYHSASVPSISLVSFPVLLRFLAVVGMPNRREETWPPYARSTSSARNMKPTKYSVYDGNLMDHCFG